MLDFVEGAVWVPVFTAIDLKDVTIKFKDLNGVNELQLLVGSGDLNYTERRNVEYVLDLGVLDDVTEGDEVPMDVRMDFTWVYLKSPAAGVPTPHDVLKQQGLAADWVSTDADICRLFAIDIELDNLPACETNDRETITLQDFRYEELDQQLRNKTLSVTGKCNVTEAAIVRAAQS